jgi:hypothetical protein
VTQFLWSLLEFVIGISIMSACVLLIVGAAKVMCSIALLVLGDEEKEDENG